MPTPEPVFSEATERFWQALPAHYRAADEVQGWQLKRWLSGVLDVLGEVEQMASDIDYVPVHEGGDGTPSQLGDPMTAPRGWLAWLGQLVGVRLNPAMSETAARDAVRFASAGWRSGTRRAVADAARSALTGSRYVEVFSRSSADGPGTGGPFDVLLVTRASETPDVAAVLRAVDEKGAKPAGVLLHHRTTASTWEHVMRTFPTWGAIRQAGTWLVLHESEFTAVSQLGSAGLLVAPRDPTRSLTLSPTPLTAAVEDVAAVGGVLNRVLTAAPLTVGLPDLGGQISAALSAAHLPVAAVDGQVRLESELSASAVVLQAHDVGVAP